MAKVIRHGKTPQWGTYNGDKSKFHGIILDSYNYTVDVKDYEQLNEYGQVKGYMIYDQTVSYDISGTITFTEGSDGDTAPQSDNVGVEICAGYEFVPTLLYIGGVNSTINNPTTGIVKSCSVNTAQGSAWTFSASGTIYDLTEETEG